MRFHAVLGCLLAWAASATGDDGRDKIRREVEHRTGATLPTAPRAPRDPFHSPPGVTETGKLDQDTAVLIALWNNTALEADLASIGLARADLTDAKLLRNPNIQSLIPVGAKPFEFLFNWPVEVLLERKKRVLAAQRTLDGAAIGLVQNAMNLVRDVKSAHVDLWLAERRLETLRESAELRARIAELTARRRDAGDATGLDVTMAAMDSRSVAELARRAEGDVEIAANRLRMLLGMRGESRAVSAIARTDWPAPPAIEELVRSAHSSRPDLRAAEVAIEASSYRANWQRSRVLTMLAPLLSIKESGSPQAVRAGPGLSIELPLFHRNQGQIARADAEVEQAAWRYAMLRDQAEADVRDAIARLRQARAWLAALRTDMWPVLREAIARTEAAHRNGDASTLNVLEAKRLEFDAILREHDAEALLARAHADLERATGKRL